MNKNKIYKYLKIIVITISFVLIYINSKENFKNVINNFNLDYQIIVLSILIIMIIQNLLNMRSFYFLKLTSKYDANFIQWSSLFFLTGLINQSPLWGAGHVLRSYEMKKNNYSHKQYVSMYFFIFFWGTLIYSLILILFSFLFNKINFYTLTILFILSLLSFIVTNVLTLKFCSKIFKIFTNYRLIKKLKFFNYFFKEILKLIELSTLISNKRVFINFFFFTFLLMCFEYSLLNIIFKFLLETLNYQVLFLFFLINFLIRCVKPVDNVIGIKETILGFYGQQLGLLFFEGALIALIWRLLGVVSLILNYTLYYLASKTLNNKIKN